MEFEEKVANRWIGKALKSVGLLDEKKSSGRYWPVDFAEVGGLELKKGAYLGAEETVLLNKHTKNKYPLK